MSSTLTKILKLSFSKIDNCAQVAVPLCYAVVIASTMLAVTGTVLVVPLLIGTTLVVAVAALIGVATCCHFQDCFFSCAKCKSESYGNRQSKLLTLFQCLPLGLL